MAELLLGVAIINGIPKVYFMGDQFLWFLEMSQSLMESPKYILSQITCSILFIFAGYKYRQKPRKVKISHRIL